MACSSQSEVSWWLCTEGPYARVQLSLSRAVDICSCWAIAVVALSSGQPLQLEMLPWQGQDAHLVRCSAAALVGLLSVILAIFRKMAAAVLRVEPWPCWPMMARGFFFSHYYFAGPPEFYRALCLTAGALIAVLGAWFQALREPLR
jgi:hypothetical protein